VTRKKIVFKENGFRAVLGEYPNPDITHFYQLISAS